MRQTGLRLHTILLLLIVGTLLSLDHVRSAAEVNLANTYLVKGLTGSVPVREQYVQHFLDWARAASQRPTMSFASLYGLGIVSLDRDPSPLFASKVAVELWESGGSRSRQRGQLLLHLVGRRLTKLDDIRLVAGMFDKSAVFSWLATSARAHWQNKDFEVAGAFLQVMSEADEFPPKSFHKTQELADLYVNVGWEQWNAKLERDAISNFDRALTLMPDNEHALIFKGYVVRSLGQVDEGMRLTRRALELYPDSYETWHFWGAALASIGQLTEAERAQRRAMELGPKNSWVKLNLARTLMQQGRHEEALTYAQQAVALAADHSSRVETLQFLGDLYWSLGDTVRASDAYRRLIGIDPDRYDRLKERLAFPKSNP